MNPIIKRQHEYELVSFSLSLICRMCTCISSVQEQTSNTTYFVFQTKLQYEVLYVFGGLLVVCDPAAGESKRYVEKMYECSER